LFFFNAEKEAQEETEEDEEAKKPEKVIMATASEDSKFLYLYS
jgi:hypothetical protein